MAFQDVTWSNGEVVDSSKLNQMHTNAKHALRSVNQNYELATGTKEVTYPGSTDTVLESIVFATEADDGDPGFTATPIIWIQIIESTGTSPSSAINTFMVDPTSTGFDLQVRTQDIPPSGRKVNTRWFALGPV
jgi:uncharacterized protein YegP (UPF0339 family)